MIRFSTIIKKFAEKGEKTGWTYIEIPIDVTDELFPGNKKSFRIKGKLDSYTISGVALLPIGGGMFIMPINGTMRKAIHKNKGSMILVQLSIDKEKIKAPSEFLDCLSDEPKAKAFFEQLTTSHRNYYIKWLLGVKTETAFAKRIAQAINALSNQMNFVEMYHFYKSKREKEG